AIAWYRLAEYEKALLDLDVLAERATSLLVTGGRDYRALVHARLGPAEEARRDLADLQRRNFSPGQFAFVDAAVAVYLGNDAEGLKRLDEALAARPGDANFPYDAARAYALASAAVISRQPERGKAYAARALALLQAAVANGFEDYRRMQADDDLEVLHGWTEFQALLRPGRLDRQYSACWATGPALASEESHRLD